MASAVVAVFDELAEAQSAVQELIRAGFDSHDLTIDAPNLFDEEELKPYDEAVNHGQHVVAAYASTDDRADIATEVMSSHNPVGVDESTSSVRVFHDVYEVPAEVEVEIEQLGRS